MVDSREVTTVGLFEDEICFENLNSIFHRAILVHAYEGHDIAEVCRSVANDETRTEIATACDATCSQTSISTTSIKF